MFFKKKPDPIVQNIDVPTSLSWPEPDQSRQELWINISQWHYKIFPTLKGKSSNWLFQFEGKCGSPPLKDIEAVGDIEIQDNDKAGWLPDDWGDQPDTVEGYSYLSTHEWDKTIPPSIGITLYCKPDALDLIYRAFIAGGSGIKGGIGLLLTIDCPNNTCGDFWNVQWRSEKWRVLKWGLYASSQFSN
jgi:hypothetical protein